MRVQTHALVAMEGFRHFLVALCAAGAVGLVSIIFVLRWVLHFKEGFAWDGGLAEFNWHPVLMVTGFIFLQGVGEETFLFLRYGGTDRHAGGPWVLCKDEKNVNKGNYCSGPSYTRFEVDHCAGLRCCPPAELSL